MGIAQTESPWAMNALRCPVAGKQCFAALANKAVPAIFGQLAHPRMSTGCRFCQCSKLKSINKACKGWYLMFCLSIVQSDYTQILNFSENIHQEWGKYGDRLLALLSSIGSSSAKVPTFQNFVVFASKCLPLFIASVYEVHFGSSGSKVATCQYR